MWNRYNARRYGKHAKESKKKIINYSLDIIIIILNEEKNEHGIEFLEPSVSKFLIKI